MRTNTSVVSTLRQPEDLIAHGLAPAAALPDLTRDAAR
jgi:lysine 2,3-aminomutase